jgi:hypothetical protein
MKTYTEIVPEMPSNEDKFKDPFFKRFKLRHADAPLQLNEQVSKNYLFPTFYSDVTCAQAIFLCDYKKAKALMPHPRVKPVKMTQGRAIVAFSNYIYTNVMNVKPYNEIAMTIPIMVDPVVNVPVLPMLMDKLFKEFGYFVFSMPVTSLENQLRGVKIWGLPKVVQEIDITVQGGECVTEAFDENGEKYLTVKVPTAGKPEDFDVAANLYSRRGSEFFQSATCFKASFNVNKSMEVLLKKGKEADRDYLTLHRGPCADALRELDIEPMPLQTRFATGMNACFDLPNKKYRPRFSFSD